MYYLCYSPESISRRIITVYYYSPHFRFLKCLSPSCISIPLLIGLGVYSPNLLLCLNLFQYYFICCLYTFITYMTDMSILRPFIYPVSYILTYVSEHKQCQRYSGRRGYLEAFTVYVINNLQICVFFDKFAYKY